MKMTLAVALAALTVACSQKQEHPIQYAAPRTPTASEQTALGGTQTTLSASVAPLQPSSQPGFGVTGLVDQLAAQLSTYAIAAGVPAGSAAKLAGDTVRQAFDMTGMPACVQVDQPLDQSHVTVTWTGCHVEVTDPTSSTSADITGSITWTAATGLTEWHIQDATVTTMTSGGQTYTIAMTANLDGAITVTATRISGTASSRFLISEMGLNLGLNDALSLDVGYAADPFCITSGWLDVVQTWDPRPAGMTYDQAPDLGWHFEWTGCNAFTVAVGRN